MKGGNYTLTFDWGRWLFGLSIGSLYGTRYYLIGIGPLAINWIGHRAVTKATVVAIDKETKTITLDIQ